MKPTSLLGVFFSGLAHSSCAPERPGAASHPGRPKTFPSGTGFEGRKRSWTAAQAQHCEGLGEATFGMCSLTWSRSSRIEEIMERSWGLAQKAEQYLQEGLKRARNHEWPLFKGEREAGNILETKDVRGARAVEYLPRRATHREWSQPKGQKCIAISEVGSAEPSKFFNSRHGVTVFGVCPPEFQSCFGSTVPHYVPFPQFWNGNVSSWPLYDTSL